MDCGTDGVAPNWLYDTPTCVPNKAAPPTPFEAVESHFLFFSQRLSTLVVIVLNRFLCPPFLHEQCPAALAILPAYHHFGPLNRNLSTSHSSRYEDSPDSLLSNEHRVPAPTEAKPGPAQTFTGRNRLPTWAVPFSVGVVTCVFGSAFGLYVYYRSHFDVVPITNRNRMIWYDSDFDEEIGFPVAEWMLNRKGKPMLRPDDPVAKAVHGVMSRLTLVDIVQGLNIKTYILDDMG